MSLESLMITDLKVLYDSDEFATSVGFRDKNINVILNDDDEIISDAKEKTLSAIYSDVVDIALGEIFKIKNKDYEVFNFDFKDNTELEMLIAIKRV
jgi:hypothetical protein